MEKSTLLAAIDAAQSSLAEKEAEARQLCQQQEEALIQSANADQVLQQRITRLERGGEEAEAQKDNLLAVSEEAESLRQKLGVMQQQLDCRSHDDKSLQRLSEEKSVLVGEISRLRDTLRELEAEEFGAKQLNEAYKEEIVALKSGTDSHAARLLEMIAEHEQQVQAAAEEVK